MTTAEEEDTAPHNRLELLSRTAAWRNVIEKSQDVVPVIASFPGRVTPAEPGVFFPDPSFGARTVTSSSGHPWTAMRPVSVTRNAMSFDDGDNTPYRAFGACGDQGQGNPPTAPLDIANSSSIRASNSALENNRQSQDMLRPKPVASFARANPSLPSASHSGLSTQAAFAPPRSRVNTDANHPPASVTSNTSRPSSRQGGSPPSLQSQFFQGYAMEGGYPYSSNSGCTLRPTPAHSVASPWMSHPHPHAPPPNYHGGHGGYATTSSSSEAANYRALADENAKLRHQVQQKETSVAALEAKVRHLETQIGELRELPTGKISHIPIEDMLAIMEEYGSETTEATLSSRRKAANVKKSSVVRQFRRWNPNFLEFFSFRQGQWVPNLGREKEIQRRVRARSQAVNTRKQKAVPGDNQDQSL